MKKRIDSNKLDLKKKLRLDVETLRSLSDAEAGAAEGASGGACETRWLTCSGCQNDP